MARYTVSTSDRNEALQIMKATSYLIALWDLDQWLRSEIKYSGKEEYQPVRDELYNILQSNGISLDELE